MLSRTQIAFGSEEHRKAKAKAAAMGVSLGEYVRRLVARDLAETPREKPSVDGVFGLFDSGGSDIARHKHQYVAEAFDQGHPRPSRHADK
jgi:hypothetical protein